MLSTHRNPARMLAIAVLAAGATVIASPPAAAIGLYAGACVMTIGVAYSPTLAAAPAPTSMTLNGSGTCVVNSSVVPGYYSAGAAGVAGLMACGGGLASGTGYFFTTAPGFPYTVVQTQVARAGPLAVIAVESGIALAGAGVFVQDTGAVTGCAGGGVSSSTWTGVLAFEDPTL